MAISPGRSVTNTQKREQELMYISRLREIPKSELMEILPYEGATKISKLAEEKYIFSNCIDEKNDAIRFNTAIYDDEAEEYIFNDTLSDIIDIARKAGDHESAENVRILRSARAVIYYTLKER